MKRVIKSNSIFGQAMYLDQAKRRVQGLGEEVQEHLIKLLVYRDTSNDFNKWISEISEWLSQINDIDLKIKRNPPKLKYEEYEEYVFGTFGDARSDMYSALDEYRRSNLKLIKSQNSDAYPNFELTDDLTDQAFSAISDICKSVCTILCIRNDKRKSDFEALLHSKLDRFNTR